MIDIRNRFYASAVWHKHNDDIGTFEYINGRYIFRAKIDEVKDVAKMMESPHLLQ